MITKTLTGRITIEEAKGGLSSVLNLFEEAYMDVELTLESQHQETPVLSSPFHGASGTVTVRGTITSTHAKNSYAKQALSLLLSRKKTALNLQIPVQAGVGSYKIQDKDMEGNITFQMLSPIATTTNGLPALQVVVDLKPVGATAYVASSVRASGTLNQTNTKVQANDTILPVNGSSPTDSAPNMAWRFSENYASFTLSAEELTLPVGATLTSGNASFVAEIKRSTLGHVGGIFRVQVPAGAGRLTLVYGSQDKDVFDLPELRTSYENAGGIRVAATKPANPTTPTPTPAGSSKYVWSEEKARAWLLSRPAAFFVKDKDGKKVSPTDPMAVECVRIHGDRITHFGGGNDGYPKSEKVLWKRNSDSDGKLVLITPHSAWLTGVRIGGETVSRCSIGNGWRAHWRFSKPGSSYSGVIEFLGTDDRLQVPSADKDRFETSLDIAPPSSGYVPPPVIVNPPSQDKGVYKALMLTDVAQDKDLSSRAGELQKLAASYGCLLYLDLQYPLAGGKTDRVRPYIGPAREGSKLTSLALENLDFLFKTFRQVMVCPLGGWGAINGYGTQMGSVRRSVKEKDLYTAAQLEEEKRLLGTLLARYNVQAIMPTLEGQDPLAINWTKQYADWLYGVGYKGNVVSNLIGASRARHGELRDHGVLLAPSINKASDWGKNGAQIWNTDGMTEFTQDRTDLLQRFTGEFGPNGYILWLAGMVGSPSGRSTYSPNLLKYNSRPLAPAVPVVDVPIEDIDFGDLPSVPAPVTQPAPGAGMFGARVGFWSETGTAGRWGVNGALVSCSRSNKVAGAINLLQIHPLYSPLKEAGPWGAKARAAVASIIQKAKAEGWDGCAVDAEGSLWTEAALLEVARMIKAAGLLAAMAPKSSWDPGGKTLSSTWAGNAKIAAAYDGVLVWSYGAHTKHLTNRNQLIQGGYKGKVGCIHDTFRYQTATGYTGKVEGPKLAEVCAKEGILFMSFQPHYNDAATHARIAALFNGKPVIDVTPVTPSPGTGGASDVVSSEPSLTYETTGSSITFRKDFMAAIKEVVAYTKIQEPAGNPAGTKVEVVRPNRIGNTFVLPQPLANYPVGNKPNTWRISLQGVPPAGITYHTSIMQCFVRSGTAAGQYLEAPGKTYPPTTRR